MLPQSICLIDTSRLFREGLRRILSDSEFSVINEASSVEEALPLMETLQPSLVLTDVSGSREAVIEGVNRIAAAAPGTRIVVLTDNVQANRLADALSAGVDGYLLKNISSDALHQSLRLVLLGEKVFPTDVAHLLINERIILRSEPALMGHFDRLSDRETQILGCLLNGAQNKQIAHKLKISDGTVKVHLKAILKKIRVQNRTQAAMWALNHGMARDVSEGVAYHGALTIDMGARLGAPYRCNEGSKGWIG